MELRHLDHVRAHGYATLIVLCRPLGTFQTFSVRPPSPSVTPAPPAVIRDSPAVISDLPAVIPDPDRGSSVFALSFTGASFVQAKDPGFPRLQE